MCSPLALKNFCYQPEQAFHIQDIILRYYLQGNASFLQAVKHAASQHPLQNKIFDCNKYCNTMSNKLIPFEF